MPLPNCTHNITSKDGLLSGANNCNLVLTPGSTVPSLANFDQCLDYFISALCDLNNTCNVFAQLACSLELCEIIATETAISLNESSLDIYTTCVTALYLRVKDNATLTMTLIVQWSIFCLDEVDYQTCIELFVENCFLENSPFSDLECVNFLPVICGSLPSVTEHQNCRADIEDIISFVVVGVCQQNCVSTVYIIASILIPIELSEKVC